MNENNDFKSWYIETSAKAGGLITQKIAALLSEISESQISRRIKNGEIRTYNHPSLKKDLLSYSDTLELKRQRAKKNNE